MEDKKSGTDKIFEVIFKRTPLRFFGEGSVKKIDVAVNKLEGDVPESQKAVPTEREHTLPCDLVLRSIGR